MKQFKYQEEIDKLPCSINEFSEHNARKCYRWVYSDIKDERNFLPVSLRNPDMKVKNCKGWSLSMYETKEQARARLEALLANRSDLYLKLGTHIAEGTLTSDDGQSDTASTNEKTFGHFDHFEYCNRALDSNFEIVECIVNIEDE